MSKRLAWIGLMLALALAACARGAGPTPAAPADPIGVPVSQTLAETGLQDTVDALVDTWDIPHIYARNDHDAFFVQGYLAAADRFGQMDFARRLAQGRVSEFLGQLPLVGPLVALIISRDTDLFFRTIFMGRDGLPILDHMEAQLNERSLAVLQAYADGVNAWWHDVLTQRYSQSAPPSFSGLIEVDLTLVPAWTVRDSLSILLLAEWAATNPVDEELAMGQALTALQPAQVIDFFRLQPADPTTVLPAAGGAAGPLAPDPAAIAAVLTPAAKAIKAARNALADGLNNLAEPGRHSDNWAVDGKHAADGAALLATDQHGGLLNPTFWRLSHLDSVTLGSGSVRAAGLSAPAMPGVQLGHNAKVGWTASTAGYDAVDAYIETQASGNPQAVMRNGQAVPLTQVAVSIGLDMTGKWPPSQETIQISPYHGPVLPESCANGYCVSLAWTGADSGQEINALIDLLFVDNVASGLNAVAGYRHGAANWILADAAGRIGYAAPGAIPIRENWQNWPPFLPLPGDGNYDWNGEVPGDGNARLENPAAGYLVAANNDIFGVLLNNNPLGGSNYFYGNADLGYRAGLLATALKNDAATRTVTLADMQALQLDNVSVAAQTLLPYLFAAAAARPDLVDAAMNNGLEILSTWDFTTFAAVPNLYQPSIPTQERIQMAVGAALFHYWLGYTIENTFGNVFSKAKLTLPGNAAADGPQFETKALVELLQHPAASAWGANRWWDSGGKPPAVVTKEEVLLGALQDAINALDGALGAGMSGWAWGRVHLATYNVSINSMGLPDFLLPQIGPVAADGGDFTVNLGNTDSLTGKMTPLGGVTARLTMEIDGAANPTWAALPGGQSERTSSANYNDLMSDFGTGRNAPVYFTLEEIAPATTARLQFIPR